MFIPSYQIHNILKDFTHQLRDGNHRRDAGHRLESVVNKVADTITDRVTRLSEEETHGKMEITDIHAPPSPSPSPVMEPQPATFRYHTIGQDTQKVEKCLAVENPAQFINRFQSVIDTVDNETSEE